MELTVIIPAYNEERRIRKTIQRVLDYLENQQIPFELLVVNDGSSDRTAEVAERTFARKPHCRVVSLVKNSGKGAAIRRGMLEASGDFILFSDADLSTPIEE